MLCLVVHFGFGVDDYLPCVLDCLTKAARSWYWHNSLVIISVFCTSEFG